MKKFIVEMYEEYGCDYIGVVGIYDGCYYKDMDKKRCEGKLEARPDWCPLVEHSIGECHIKYKEKQKKDNKPKGRYSEDIKGTKDKWWEQECPFDCCPSGQDCDAPNGQDCDAPNEPVGQAICTGFLKVFICFEEYTVKEVFYDEDKALEWVGKNYGFRSYVEKFVC